MARGSVPIGWGDGMAWARVGIHSPPSLTNFQGEPVSADVGTGGPATQSRVEFPEALFETARGRVAPKVVLDALPKPLATLLGDDRRAHHPSVSRMDAHANVVAEEANRLGHR